MNALKQIAAAVFSSTLLCSHAASAATADRIRFDSHCYTINGQDTLIYSGAFHYFRCPKELWPERLQSMKSAGLNTLETYVAWDWHERTPPAGVDDFSKMDLTDLHDFLDLAINHFGFNVMIRPGPYICAEWDGGGYPQWLRLFKPAGYTGQWTRGDDPTYLAWCKHWYTAVAKVAAPFQITQQPPGKPGIILWQIENEYDYDSAHTAQQHLHQLQALAHDSRDAGIDVPLFTCMTENPLYRQDPFLLANVIETKNAYPGFDAKGFSNGIDQLRPYQPEKPLGMTELQGGWFSQVGGALSQARGYNAAQITQLTMLAWAHGFTSTNYYMMFGGTNFGDWAAAGITTSYDYAAPIRECGGVDERYQAVSSMAHMIQQIGPKLARAELEKSHIEGDAPADVSAIVRIAKDDTRFIFVFNGNKSELKKGTLKLALEDMHNATLTVDYDLKPFDAKVMVLPGLALKTAKREWLPKILPLPERPKTLPADIVMLKVFHLPDPGPTEWKLVIGDHGEEAAGVFDRRFVYYRARLPEKMPFAHTVVRCKSGVGGTFMAAGRLDVESDKPEVDVVTGSSVDLPADLINPDKTFQVVYMNNGRPNGGVMMEAPGGITEMSLVDADALERSIVDWRIKRLKNDDTGSADILADVDVSNWKKFKPGNAEELQPLQSAVYRCTLDYSANDVEVGRSLLTIGRIDDTGIIYVNGQKAGESHVWSEPIKLNLKPFLHPGQNTIAILVHNEQGAGGLGMGISLDTAKNANSTAKPLNYEIGTQSTGDAQKWYTPAFDDSKWGTSELGVTYSSHEGFVDNVNHLDWYRLHFSLPPLPSHSLVPLKLHLDIQEGDGFVYLNGHPLGRWWKQGPQNDYFLPECWLSRGHDNVVAVSLIGAHDRGNIGSPPLGGVIGAFVSPYADLSEVRP